MNLALADKSHSFEVTFDNPALSVAMSVYDDSGVSPTLVQGPSAMDLVIGNTYRGKFTPELDKQYVILKAVYTDGTFAALDSNYSQASESILGIAIAAAAVVENKADLTGTITGSEQLTGSLTGTDS